MLSAQGKTEMLAVVACDKQARQVYDVFVDSVGLPR